MSDEDKRPRAKTKEPEPEAKAAPQASPDKTANVRGPLSPAQFEDDGWGDTPVQMRG